MEIIFATFSVLIYALICLSLGIRLTTIVLSFDMSSRQYSEMVILCTSFLFGQAVIAAIWQLIALAGWFNIPIVGGIGFLALLSGITLLPAPLIKLYLATERGLNIWRKEPILWRILLQASIILIIITAIQTTMSPMPRGDAMAFYMAYPRLIAATGDLAIIPTGYFDFAQVGIQGELHYATLMLFGNFTNPELFTWLTTLGGVGLLSSLAGYAGGKHHSKLIILLSVFTSSAITIVIWDGKVDIFGASMGLATYFWAVQVKDSDKSALCLSGLFAGFAIIAKISYAVFLPIAVATIIFWRFYIISREKQISFTAIFLKLVRVGIILAVWAAIPAVPQVIKNSVIFDAPLAPIIAENNEAFVEQSWFNQQTTNRILLSYPFSLTFGNFWGQGGQMSPILLAFSPLIFLLKIPDEHQRQLTYQIGLISIISIILWVVFRASVFAPRYMLAPLLLMCIPVGLAVEYVTLNQVYSGLKTFIIAILMSIIAIFLLNNAKLTLLSASILTGYIDECSYEFVNQDGTCRIAKTINSEAPDGTRILNLSYFSYWLRTDLAQCATADLTVIAESSSNAVWQYVAEQGYQYLIVDTLTHNIFYENLIEDVPEWVTLERFFDKSSYLAFRINLDSQLENTEFYPNFTCTETSPNIWQVAEN